MSAPTDSMGSMPVSLSGSGGSAGPSSSNGMFGPSSWGGMDNSDWTVVGAGGYGTPGTVSSKRPSVAIPASVGYTSDQYGLPNTVTSLPLTPPASRPTTITSTTATASVSPLLIVAALVIVLALRHRK